MKNILILFSVFFLGAAQNSDIISAMEACENDGDIDSCVSACQSGDLNSCELACQAGDHYLSCYNWCQLGAISTCLEALEAHQAQFVTVTTERDAAVAESRTASNCSELKTAYKAKVADGTCDCP